MSWIYKAEKKFGKYAVTNLMKYVIGLKVFGAVLGLTSPMLYMNYLAFDVNAILHGQIWRLFTFILSSEVSMENGQMFMDILFFAIWSYMYYFIGNAIERTWGTFRFNLYFFTGTLATIIFAFLYCMITNDPVSGFFYMNLDFIFQAMFLTFALMFPETSFLLYFVIPIKAKWLGYAGAALSLYQALSDMMNSIYISILLFIVAYANFLLFYLMTNNPKKRARFFDQPSKKRKVKYKNTAFKSTAKTEQKRHKCTICGKTEADDENLTFRYCSKCDGDYEYCSEHLFTHKHISKNQEDR